MEFNKYQTPIEELSYIYVDEKTGEQTHYTWNNCPEEIKEEFNEHLATIPFIQYLISKDRPYCKDLPRDENGRAIWKVTEPPIIEDTDYFRETAIHFQETGRYTDLRPNPNPNSAYRKWIDREADRIYNGMLRESDGAWIPGDMYWYLNYSPIILTKDGENETTGDRDTDLPRFWEGILWRFIGWTDARRVGQNFAEIAKRGASKSFSVASKLSKTFIMGNRRRTEEEIRARKPQNAGGVVVAYDKQFLIKDGTLNKFEQMIDHCANNTEFPRKTLQRTLNDMSWESGYIDLNTGAKAGTRNTVLGVAVKDDVDKIRGKRKEFICFEEFGKFPNLSDAYNISLKSVKEGNKWFGEIILIGTGGEEGNDFSSAMDMIYHPTGFFLRAFDNVWDKAGQSRGTSIFFFPAYVNRAGCYNNDGISDVTLALFSICCDRYIAKYHNPDPMQITRTKAEDPVTIQDAIMRRDGTKFPVAQITERIQEIDLNPNFYDNILVGKLIQRSNGEVVFEPTGDTPIRKFPTKDNKVAGAVEIKELPVKGPGGKPMAGRYIAGCLKEGELVSTTRGLVPVQNVTLNDRLINIEGEEVEIKNLQRYYNTSPVYKVKLRGQYRTTTFSEEHPIYCATPERHYNGIKRVHREGVPERYYTYNFDFRKVSDLKIGDVVKSPNVYRKEKPYMHYWNDFSRVDRRIENPLDKEDFWWFIGLMLGDGWAQGNGYKIGISINKKEIEYIDKAKACIENIFKRGSYEKKGHGCISLEFSHQYFNAFFRENFGTSAYNKHIPEWVKYIPERFKKQLFLGYLSSDGSITRGNAEFVSVSLALLEGIQDIGFSLGLCGGITKLRNKKASDIQGVPIIQQETYHLRYGILDARTMSTWGTNYKFGKLKPIKDASHNIKSTWFSEDLKYIYFKVERIETEDYIGTIYNFECDTHTFMCHWIPTHNCDPVDDDSSNTMSLVSMFVLDLWTDSIVAEWTGRLESADACYEVCRLLLIFYNAKCNYENNKKGFYSYMKMRNCLQYLEEELEIVRAKSSNKIEKIGNKLYGTNASVPINNWGRDLLKDYMLKPVVQAKNGEDDEEVTIPNVMTWWNRALLEEARQWNPDGNFDRISAMGMLMLIREDRRAKFGEDFNGLKSLKVFNPKAKDPFFEKNYNHGKEQFKLPEIKKVPAVNEKVQWQ